MAEKVNHVRQEVVDVIIEGDRRRTSMMVENVIDPDLYLAALSDFLYTIATTYAIDYRPRQRNGVQAGSLQVEPRSYIAIVWFNV